MSTTIFSVNDFPGGFWLKYIPRVGHKHLPPKAKGESYSKLVIEDGSQRRETHDPDDPIIVPIPSLDLAQDLLSIGTEESLLRFGLGIAAGAEPTEGELLEATDRMRAHQTRLIDEADEHYRQTKNTRGINAHARWALSVLGLTREWGTTTGKTSRCPYCGVGHHNDVAICPNCKNVVNVEKHAALKAQEKAAKAPAAPKPAEG